MKVMRIIIFTIIGILILGCIGAVTAYFTTDIFISNQDMFYKYLAQENVSDFLDVNFTKNFINKLQTEPNNTKGKVIINAKVDGQNILKNSKVTFDNNLDEENELFESKISFSDDTSKNLLELEIVRNQDVYGVMIKDIITQYLAIENNNLKNFTNKLGFNANTLNIPDRLEKDEYVNKINDIGDTFAQDLSEIFDHIKEKVSKESYSKIEKTNIEINGENQEVTGYKLILNNTETNEILSKIDEDLLERANNFIENFTSVAINEDELKTEIIAYIKDKKLVKVNVLINSSENVIINLSKTFSNNIVYKLEISKDDNQMILNVVKNSELDMSNISYNLDISIKSAESDSDINANIEINTKFDSEITVIEFDDKNCVIANNMDATTLIGVLKILGQKIYSETGFGNTILGIGYNIYNSSANTLKNTQLLMQNTEVQMHNSMFEQYSGEQKGIAVKSLLNIVETNNATSENVVIEILYNNAETEIEINDDNKYDISFKYDNEGYINAVNINEK